MHITSYSGSKVRVGSHSGPGHTTRHICTLRRGGPMPNVPPVHTLSISMLKHSTHARRWPPMRLCCCRRPLQPPRRCPCSCRPTGRAPLSRPAGRLKDAPTGDGRTGPGGRMASTTSRLPSGCCISGLVQLPPTAALAVCGLLDLAADCMYSRLFPCVACSRSVRAHLEKHIQADLAINFLGPSTTARARSNSF